jgi:polyribonucleotide nucleotidyltransferase
MVESEARGCPKRSCWGQCCSVTSRCRSSSKPSSELAAEVNKAAEVEWDWQAPAVDPSRSTRSEAEATSACEAYRSRQDGALRRPAIGEIKQAVVRAAHGRRDAALAAAEVYGAFEKLEKRDRARAHPRRQAAHRRARHQATVRGSPSVRVCCRAPMARRCSPAARPRRW